MVRLKLPKSRERLRREAARWLARLQSGRDPAAEREFARWRDKDPAHEEAFDRIVKSYEKSGLLRASNARSATVGEAAAPRSSKPAYAIAAAIVLALLAGTLVSMFGQRLLPRSTEAVMLSTGKGEIRSVSLSDGTNVTLDGATAIEVQLNAGHRHATIRRGRARFDVKSSTIPFVIDSGGAIARVEEGLVDAERTSDQIEFDILTGRADVHAPTESDRFFRPLGAGTAVRLIDGRFSRSPLPPGKAAWAASMLQFDATPLGAVAARANLYSDEKILIEPGLENLKVSGAFRTGDTRGLANALASAFHLSLIDTGDKRLILRSRP